MSNQNLENVNAVHENDLDIFMAKINLKDKLLKGELTCKFCNKIITRQNLYLLLPESGAFNPVCDQPECITAAHSYIEEKKSTLVR